MLHQYHSTYLCFKMSLFNKILVAKPFLIRSCSVICTVSTIKTLHFTMHNAHKTVKSPNPVPSLLTQKCSSNHLPKEMPTLLISRLQTVAPSAEAQFLSSVSKTLLSTKPLHPPPSPIQIKNYIQN